MWLKFAELLPFLLNCPPEGIGGGWAAILVSKYLKHETASLEFIDFKNTLEFIDFKNTHS